jgi:hypothetical protein
MREQSRCAPAIWSAGVSAIINDAVNVDNRQRTIMRAWMLEHVCNRNVSYLIYADKQRICSIPCDWSGRPIVANDAMNRAPWWKHTAIVVGGAVAFMAAAGWSYQPWWEYAFLSDDSPVSWLSSALLVASAAIAFDRALTEGADRRRWGLLAVALMWMALDEQFMFHEWFKDTVAATSGHRTVSAFANLPTLVLGLAGLILLVTAIRKVSERPARRLLQAAIAVGLFALFVDLAPSPVSLGRLEEAYEVLAESLFLCGLLELRRGYVQSSSVS